MKESRRKKLAVFAGIVFTAVYCFFVNGFQLDSEFELTKAVPTPLTDVYVGTVDKTDNEATPDNNTGGEKININTADAETLEKLDGIGEKMSQRIIKYREENGGFKQIEDIMKVKGIGEKTFLQFENNICVD